MSHNAGFATGPYDDISFVSLKMQSDRSRKRQKRGQTDMTTNLLK
jgi:hypothetical protein